MFEKQKENLLMKKLDLLREKQRSAMRMFDFKGYSNIQKQIDETLQKLDIVTGKRYAKEESKLNEKFEKTDRMLDGLTQEFDNALGLNNMSKEENEEVDRLLDQIMKGHGPR